MDFQSMDKKANAERFECGYLKTKLPKILPAGLWSDAKSRRNPIFRGALKKKKEKRNPTWFPRENDRAAIAEMVAFFARRVATHTEDGILMPRNGMQIQWCLGGRAVLFRRGVWSISRTTNIES